LYIGSVANFLSLSAVYCCKANVMINGIEGTSLKGTGELWRQPHHRSGLATRPSVGAIP